MKFLLLLEKFYHVVYFIHTRIAEILNIPNCLFEQLCYGLTFMHNSRTQTLTPIIDLSIDPGFA